MQVAGTFLYDHPAERVYHVFTDPNALLNAVPGLQSLEAVAPDRWDAVIKVGVGGFALTYRGTVAVVDRRPGRGYRIVIDAETANGSAAAQARLSFHTEGESRTRVSYEADVEFRGAQKLLPAIARGLVDFFMHGMDEYLRKQGDGKVD